MNSEYEDDLFDYYIDECDPWCAICNPNLIEDDLSDRDEDDDMIYENLDQNN